MTSDSLMHFRSISKDVARSFVTREKGRLKSARKTTTDNRISEIFATIEPLWEHAYESQTSEGQFLVVPTLAQPFVQIVKDENGKDVERYCPPLVLLVYKDKENQTKARYLVMHSEKNTFLEYVKLETFTGKLIYYDVDGQEVATKIYENGKWLPPVTETQNSGMRVAGFCRLEYNCYYSGYDENNSQDVRIYGRWTTSTSMCKSNVTGTFSGKTIEMRLTDDFATYTCDNNYSDPTPQPYPGPGSGGDGTFTPPGNNPLNIALQNKPYGLYESNNPPCETIRVWLNLAKFKVEGVVREKVNNMSFNDNHNFGHINGVPINQTYIARVLDIDNAYSAVVNMDYFEVTVSQLPKFNGRQATAGELLNYIRINLMENINGTSFLPYQHRDVDDTNLWNSSNPLGAIVGITILGDYGSVITSAYTSDQWTFSTIMDPMNGQHPVSGNRQFGYKSNADGSYSFYTRGVDRITDPFTSILQNTTNIPFYQADKLWTDWQNLVASFVANWQGQAAVRPKVVMRPDWERVKAVRDGHKPISTLSNDCN